MSPSLWPRQGSTAALQCLTVAVAVACVLMSGCASTMNGADAPVAADAASAPVARVAAPKIDPWENWNRKVFSFNEKVDTAVVRPIATAYVKVVPQPVRTGVTNFYGNFSDLWSAVNNLLQGKIANGLQDVMRVGTNTLFGIGGLFDVATEVGLERHGEDFGQTLGRWGVGAGPYLVLPLFGPSSVRDTAALPLDRAVTPALAFSDDPTRFFLAGLGLVNERANLLPATRMLDDMALDKYSFVRDAYMQRRRSLVYDGNEPEPQVEPEEGVPAATPPPASVPASAASSVRQ